MTESANTPARRKASGKRRLQRASLAVLALALLLGITGCAGQAPTTTSVSTQPSIATTTTAAHGSTTSASVPVTSTSASSSPTSPSTTAPPLTPITTPGGNVLLSPEQLAGQRVIYSYPGLTPPAELFSLISSGQVAGVLFFADNVSSLPQIASVIAEFERADASASNPVRAPLLLMTDQEGGQIRRLPGAPLPSAKQIGASADPQSEAKSAGTGAGENLKSVGMNVNLAPVLDVYRQAGNFDDQLGRSYSMNASLVSTLGASFTGAQQATGVAATAKHFPGLGAATASQNTDLAPVTLSVPLASLRGVDEAPFARAIAAGVRLVMVSWAIYPALDTTLPAGLSSTVVQGELRQRLDFQGVTITDGLGAGALAAFGTFAQRAVLAAHAGMDLMLATGTTTHLLSQGVEARDGLVGAFLAGDLSKASFQLAVERVVALRFSLAK